MSDKARIIIIYVISFILILSNVPIINGTSIIEIILKAFDITALSSKGDTGFYYPTIAMLFIVFILWKYLRKTVPKSKFSKDYFYYFFGMMFIISIVNNWIH